MICTPYVIRSVTAGLIRLDPRLEEAAMSLGATRVRAFFMVTLPLLRSSLVSGAIFAFIISFSDINLALFLTGPQSTSLPVRIFSEIQWQGERLAGSQAGRSCQQRRVLKEETAAKVARAAQTSIGIPAPQVVKRKSIHRGALTHHAS